MGPETIISDCQSIGNSHYSDGLPRDSTEAIFERPGNPYVSPKLTYARPEELHHDSEASKDAFQMRGLTWRSD